MTDVGDERPRAPPRAFPGAEATPVETRARDEARDTHALRAFVAEYSRDILTRTAPDGVTLYAAGALKTVLGFEPSEIVGRAGALFVHPDDVESAARDRERVLASDEACRSTLRVRRKDGSFVWLETLAKAVRDPETGDVVEIVTTSRDVTERRLAELATAESERRFRATFEQAAVGVGHLSIDGRWIRVNERLSDIVGYAREDLLGRPLGTVTHPDDREADADAVARLLRGDMGVHRAEVRFAHKEGRDVWVNLTLSVVRRENGEPDYFLVVVEDVSQRKRFETDLELARRELAHMEKLSALGTLVGGVAHEVRTPLTYAVNHLNWMQLRLRRAKDRPLRPDEWEKFGASVGDALQGLERINRLVLDLRRFAGRDRSQRASADLNDVVRDALDLFRATHRGRHAVESEFEALPPVAVDRVQIQQVVLNLLENASDAMRKGGRIELRTRLAGNGVEIVVADSGDGIPLEAQARIFDPFYTTKGHGMGLGLSIVKRIVESHEGSIAFETSGAGTTFVVRLPVAAT